MSDELLLLAADRIERELICCDVYERLSRKGAKERTEEEKQEARTHAICYWAGASRAIVLSVYESAALDRIDPTELYLSRLEHTNPSPEVQKVIDEIRAYHE